MKILDLFCAAGGAARGYADAGFEVVGVDSAPQPKYPFRFIHADALTLSPDFLASFDAIHASPPCQAHSSITKVTGYSHADLIPGTRKMLAATGLPWTIENVVGAPLRDPFLLCGSMFGLETSCGANLRRHRLFEANWYVGLIPECQHKSGLTITITGNTPQSNVVRNKVRVTFSAGEARRAMGIDWMAVAELRLAIPPAYTRFIGRRLLAHIERERAE
jgi:DNA (cytosine-5)-methyltransferase 1